MPVCPICKHDGADMFGEDYGDKKIFDCYKCGRYVVAGSALAFLEHNPFDPGSVKAAALSHGVRRLASSAEIPVVVNTDVLKRLIETNLLNPANAASALLVYLVAETGPEFGIPIDVEMEMVASIVGVIDGRTVEYLLQELKRKNFIRHIGGARYQLTLDGWGEYERLQHEVADSKQAFMAMPFGNTALDSIFFDYWVPAVEKAGFNLVRLDVRPKAGLIDDRLRVEIRRSRFLIAELTTLNEGAYWEAGFATGLGKPVIYTCRKDEFDNTHFDTKHHLTIIWEPGKIDDAAQQLTDCIRETLPLEADLGSREGD